MSIITTEQVQAWFEELAVLARSNRLDYNSRPESQKTEGPRYKWKSPLKNKEIKTKLASETCAMNPNFITRSSADRKSREWLYDLTVREFNEKKQLISIPLVVEIELSDNKFSGIRYDFNKLLQADSPTKILVIQQKTYERATAIFNQLRPCIEQYQHRSECIYMIACWVTSEYTWSHWHCYVEKKSKTTLAE
ncbi:MAG: hypothetical protein ACI9LY_003460 [Arenicella sp.]|jgi:hypothetical protein